MTIKAVLLDLDDTLLVNPMDQFLPRYIAGVADHALKLVPEREPDFFVKPLLKATRAMTKNLDPAVTNAAVFWQVLEKETGIDWLALEGEAHFNAYYEGALHQLQEVTTARPVAAEMVRWVQAQGWQVVIATNPLYSQRAIEARLRWAELAVTRYRFDLVTYKENMRATKPHVAYYEEILQRIGRRPEETVMVGDSWKNDIAPTAALGIANFWIAHEDDPLPETGVVHGRGSLESFFEMLRENRFGAE